MENLKYFGRDCDYPFALAAPPKPVGYWILYPGAAPSTMFAMYTKPTPEQIENTKALLGWGWKDAEP